jgi:adenylate cyclase
VKASPPSGRGRLPVKRRAARDLQATIRELEALIDVSRTVAAEESLGATLAALVRITTAATGAECGTLFLKDPETGELYSRVAQRNAVREIRLPKGTGIAGHVFTTGSGMIADDARTTEHFDPSVDEQTGFVTRSILCVPIRTVKGETIGVAEVLNKKRGRFTKGDLALLEAMTMQAAMVLNSSQFVERLKRNRAQELEFLDIVSDVTSEIDLGTLLRKVMAEATRMLDAGRSTLFLNDEKTNELWSQVGEGLGVTQIRFPNHLGIAGAVFQTGETINIRHAYADSRFNPSFDRQTGYFTRSILCVPVVTKKGKRIGATQVLNKRGGPFTAEDESRLKAFTAQVSIALENAKLFDEVQNMKNYAESILQSMSSGVITLDEELKVLTCNAAGLRILRASDGDLLRRKAADVIGGANAWVLERVKRVEETQAPDISMDAPLEANGDHLSVNLTVVPLLSGEKKKLGTMLMIEDISSEKRIKTTMARYMDPELADKLLAGGDEILGGLSTTATVLFSDIRGFTTLTEELGPQGTVSFLNEYFTLMVDCIQREGGMLDKFIGDAVMAAFGIPIAHADDEDRAMRAAVAMITELFAWNEKRGARGQKPVDMGIGLNTDLIVSGNIGSPKRMDYTVIGDGVNLAARLESACKQYGARILVSENTFRKLRGTYRSREVDRVIVKGKTQPVGVYEILDYHTEQTFPNVMEALGCFKAGIESYRDRKWDEAIAAFEDVLAIRAEDKPSQVYIERCRTLRTHPPAEDWSGVWTMTEK